LRDGTLAAHFFEKGDGKGIGKGRVTRRILQQLSLLFRLLSHIYVLMCVGACPLSAV